MLSVCIPVYNVNVTDLVNKLLHQSESNSLVTEILIFDDGSLQEYKDINRKLNVNTDVKYVELEKNLGSAAIRNKLAEDAFYENLLFLDSDSDIHDNFLKIYIPYLNSVFPIVYGGRIHPEILPSLDKSLRWKVGKIKEDHSAAIRNKVPNKSFMSNNFLIKKKLCSKIKFDETIARSGHEDTMFGIELEQKGITIIHIDNPVVHIGLESNIEFITKTEQRLETLKYLEQLNKNNKLFYQRITILKYYKLVKKLKINWLIKVAFNISKGRINKLLQSKDPSMCLYDFYKLGYYLTISKTNI